MISPEAVPRIDGDMAELTGHADSMTRAALAFTDTGARVHQTWQTLSPVYIAPEDDVLFAATGSVQGVSASVGEDVQAAAAALRVYATETAAIQTRLDALRAQASELAAAVGAAQDESTTVTLEERGDELTAAVADQLAAWEAAQLACANALRVLSGAMRLPRYTAVLPSIDYGGAGTLPPEPTGPRPGLFPIDPVPPAGTTEAPPEVLGPQILVNVPGPLGPTVVDGPGSYQPPPGPSIIDGPGSYPPHPGTGTVDGPGSYHPELGPLLGGLGPGVSLNSGDGGPAEDGIGLDSTGKVHGPLPPYVPGNWTEDDLEDLADDLRISIANRNLEQQRLGEDGPHRARIGEEEQLLRQIENILNG